MDRVKEVLSNILQAFQSNTIPEAVAYAVIPAPKDIPSSKWSFLNRTIMFLSGTYDARGMRQWNEQGRKINKGAKAIYILIPCIYKKTDEDNEEHFVLKGFKSAPVFRMEDTNGTPLEYEINLPELPLYERAKEWGISVKAIPGDYKFYGFFSKTRNEIGLATKDEHVFFHEMSHASHNRIKELKGGQDPFQEIVAELSAEALSRLVGKRLQDTTGNSYKYIESYAEKLKLTAHKACLKVLSEVEQVINLIIGRNGNGEAETEHRPHISGVPEPV